MKKKNSFARATVSPQPISSLMDVESKCGSPDVRNPHFKRSLTAKGTGSFSLLVVALLLCVAHPVFSDGGANHRTQNNNYGTSGGNIKDITTQFCCSGTFGSLVKDGGGAQYILSNNHVLARTGQAAGGEDVSQPGLIDNSCQVPRIVGDFFGAAPLGSNVDAAVAKLRSGTMNTSGAIED